MLHYLSSSYVRVCTPYSQILRTVHPCPWVTAIFSPTCVQVRAHFDTVQPSGRFRTTAYYLLGLARLYPIGATGTPAVGRRKHGWSHQEWFIRIEEGTPYYEVVQCLKPDKVGLQSTSYCEDVTVGTHLQAYLPPSLNTLLSISVTVLLLFINLMTPRSDAILLESSVRSSDTGYRVPCSYPKSGQLSVIHGTNETRLDLLVIGRRM